MPARTARPTCLRKGESFPRSFTPRTAGVQLWYHRVKRYFVFHAKARVCGHRQRANAHYSSDAVVTVVIPQHGGQGKMLVKLGCEKDSIALLLLSTGGEMTIVVPSLYVFIVGGMVFTRRLNISNPSIATRFLKMHARSDGLTWMIEVRTCLNLPL